MSSKLGVYNPPATAQLKPCTVDFDLRRAPVPVHLMQYDMTIPVLLVGLYRNGVPYELVETASVNIRMDKGDGTCVYNPALGTNIDRTAVYIAVTPQMTVCSGVFYPIIELMVDGGIAGTGPLQLIVDRNPVQAGSVESTDERKTIQQLVADAQTAANAAADTAAGVAQYVEQANTAAEKAETSATAAGSSADQAQAAASAAGNFAQAAADAAEEAQESANTAAAAKSSAEGSAAAAEESKTAAASSAKAAADTKADIDSIIAGLGAGDMAATTYDPQGKGTDIYEYADSAASSAKTAAVEETADKLTGKMNIAAYDPDGKGENIYTYADEAARKVSGKYIAILLLDGWSDTSDEDKAQGYLYTQTVAIAPKEEGLPAVTADSIFETPVDYTPTHVTATDDVLDAVLVIVNDGITWSGDGTITTIVKEKPTADFPAEWQIKA